MARLQLWHPDTHVLQPFPAAWDTRLTCRQHDVTSIQAHIHPLAITGRLLFAYRPKVYCVASNPWYTHRIIILNVGYNIKHLGTHSSPVLGHCLAESSVWAPTHPLCWGTALQNQASEHPPIPYVGALPARMAKGHESPCFWLLPSELPKTHTHIHTCPHT